MSSRCTTLLREALALPAAERQAFLDRACGDDAALRAQLDHLLALDAEWDEVLDASVEDLASVLLADEDTADDVLPDNLEERQRVGAWRLLRRLGDGGMGSVWLAERADGQYDLQVALKTIKLGMDSAMVLAQFRRERELLARLRHPNIAALVDAGIDDDGRPWFAMEYAEGVPLRDWLATGPSLRLRLKMFRTLCRAVAHAHRQLVIHRDIKPGNILVKTDGEPWLLDFGIAKLLQDEAGDATATLVHFGTHDYAAPEQVRGEPVSTATDVYALGAVLFEILTGQRYSKLHQIDTAPLKPSRADGGEAQLQDAAVPAKRLRGDLDAIVMRALAEEPERRYPGAGALAADVDNYLSGQAVKARPDSAWYRLRKLVRRNPVATAALAVAFVALAAGLFVSLQQTAQARHQRTLAERQTAFAQQQAAEAERARANAKDQARRAEAVSNYLKELLASGRTGAQGIQVQQRTVADLLEASADSLHDELEAQPALRDDLYTLLVEIFASSGRPQRALALAQERLAAAESAWGADDVRVAPAAIMLGAIRTNHGQADKAAKLLQRAEGLLDAAGDKDSFVRAQLWRWQGFQGMLSGQPVAWEGKRLRKAVDLLRRKYPVRNQELLAALFQLILVADKTAHYEEEIALIKELRQRALKQFGGRNMYTMYAAFAETNMYLSTGKPDRAYEVATRGVEEARRYLGEHHHDVLEFQTGRIRALLAAGRIDEARALWQEANEQRLQDFPDDKRFARIFKALDKKIEAKSKSPEAG